MAHGITGRNTRPPDGLRRRPLKESSKRPKKELHEQASDERKDSYHKTQYRNLVRSEEHTSELQSRFDLVCRLLLEKKKKQNNNITN